MSEQLTNLYKRVENLEKKFSSITNKIKKLMQGNAYDVEIIMNDKDTRELISKNHVIVEVMYNNKSINENKKIYIENYIRKIFGDLWEIE